MYEPDAMTKLNLSYSLYGAIVIASLAWILIGLLLMQIYIYNTGMVGPPYGNRIFLILIPLPWVALVGLSWLAYTLQNRGKTDAAWATTFFSLMLLLLYVVFLFILLMPREL